MTDVKIIHCDQDAELYRRYNGQSKAQPAYIELGVKDGILLADYDAEVGGGEPPIVRNGFDRRYSIPVLTGEAANRVMDEIAPLARRILADWSEKWDGNNHIAVLGPEAQAAEEEIEKHLGLGYHDRGFEHQGFDDSDLVTAWDIDGVTNGCEVEDYNITPSTTDERLDEIETEITRDLSEVGASDVVVVHGLDEYLRGLRDELVEQDEKDLWVIVAASGDRVDGAEMAEINPAAADVLWTIPEFADLARAAGYSPEQPEVLIYLQTESDQLQIPDGFEYTWLEVPSHVEAAVAAVERPA